MKVKQYGLIMFSILISVCLNFSFATESNSKENQHWGAEVTQKWVDLNVIDLQNETIYQILDRSVTRAELASVLNKVFLYDTTPITGYFKDIKGNEVYAQAVYNLYNNGIVSGSTNGTFEPNRKVTREEAASMFAKVFLLKDYSQVSNQNTVYKDEKMLSKWSSESVRLLSDYGYMSGYNGYFNPKLHITYSELAGIMNNLVTLIPDELKIEAKTIDGNVMVTQSGTQLTDVVINGNLYISPAVGTGEVYLENVRVSGNFYVLAGGKNSVYLEDTQVANKLIVDDLRGIVRIVTTGESAIQTTIVRSGAHLYDQSTLGDAFSSTWFQSDGANQLLVLEGNFSSVTVANPNSQVKLEKVSVNTFVMSKEALNSVVQVNENAIINLLNANAPSKVTGNGAIKTVQVNTPDLVSDIKPQKTMGTMPINYTLTITSEAVPTSPTIKQPEENVGGSNPIVVTPPQNPEPTKPTEPIKKMVKNMRITAVGPVVYLSVAFESGSLSEYRFLVNGVDRTNDFSPVTSDSKIVKLEITEDINKLVVVSKKTGETETYSNLYQQ